MTGITRLEEVSINALPSLNTIYLDGWVLRFADSYTRRANSVYPLYPGSLELTNKIASCENYYRAAGIPLNFKITRESKPPQLDQTLERLGYLKIDETLIMTINLETVSVVEDPAFTLQESFSEEWLLTYSNLMELTEHKRQTFRSILSKIMLPTDYVLFRVDEKPSGCGLCVTEGLTAGFFDIHIDRDIRRKGYGKKLMLTLMDKASRRGAKLGYLQVLGSNKPAIELYRSLGFTESYSYWYRARPEPA